VSNCSPWYRNSFGVEYSYVSVTAPAVCQQMHVPMVIVAVKNWDDRSGHHTIFTDPLQTVLGYLTPDEFAQKVASPSSASNTTRPALPQGFPDCSAVAAAPAPALTQRRPCEEVLR
jgi:hypothetical protein